MIKIHENSHHFFFQISFFKMQFLEKYLIFYSHFFLRVTRGAHNSNLQVPVVLKVDSVIQLLNNWGQVVIMLVLHVCSQHSFGTCTKNEWNVQNAI